MPWYKSGTTNVTQNSNAVIGTGTAFIANSRVGDAFRGPDGGWYEVTNIASDTAMSIAPNYQGVTNSAGTYALAPMQGYVKDSADSLRTLVNQFGGVLAVLGTTPTTAGVRAALNLSNADGLSDGTTNKYLTNARVLASVLTGLDTATNSPVAATDSIVVAAGKLQAQASAALPKAGGALTGPINGAPTQTMSSAATVDIGAATSNVIAISGTTAITSLGTIAAGVRRTIRFLGALVLTHNAASLILPGALNIVTALNDSAEFLSLGSGNWICLRYNLANTKPAATVGTVSQSSGAPTGAVIETATTSNGTYTKLADGTLICRGPITAFYAAANGATIAPSITFPAPFINDTYAIQGMGTPVASVDTFGFVYVAAKSTVSASLVYKNGGTAQTISPATYMAIGRWF